MDKKIPRAICEIDLDNIQNNIDVYRKNIDEKTKLCAIVKSNAYGHGSVEICKFFENEFDYFAVATPDEALELRKNSIKKPILILGYVPKFQIESLIENNIEFPIHSLDCIKDIDEVCKQNNIKAKVHVKLDTGMSRIGFTKERYIEELKSIKDNKNIEIKGIFSHFAKSGEKDQSYTENQFNLFLEMIENLEKIGFAFTIKHISNSAAAFILKYNLNMVRVGIGLYGYNPFDSNCEYVEKVKELKPTMSFLSTMYEIKKVPKDTPVGYGGKYVTEKDEWIGTIAVGYADGISRNISNKNYKVKFKNGKIGFVVGNICMDQMMVKVDEYIEPMSEVYIFNTENDFNALNLSNISETIVYESLCAIQRRVPRRYIKNGEIIKEISYI